MDYIKHYYQLPFLKEGMRVEADGMPGTINREKNGYIEVKFDSGNTALAHPTWEIVYFDEKGEIIKDFRRSKSVVEQAKTSSAQEEKTFIDAIINAQGNESSNMNTNDDFFGFGSEDCGSFGGGGASGSWDSGSSDSSSSDSSYSD